MGEAIDRLAVKLARVWIPPYKRSDGFGLIDVAGHWREYTPAQERPFEGLAYHQTAARFDRFEAEYMTEQNYSKGFYFSEDHLKPGTYGDRELRVRLRLERPLRFGEPVPATLLRDMEAALQGDPDYEALPGDTLRDKYEYDRLVTNGGHPGIAPFDQLTTQEHPDAMANFQMFVGNLGGVLQDEDSTPMIARFQKAGVDGMVFGNQIVVWDPASIVEIVSNP